MKWQRKWTIRPRKKEKGALGSQTQVPQRFSDAFAAAEYTNSNKLSSDNRGLWSLSPDFVSFPFLFS
jgi:hypothetical protein